MSDEQDHLIPIPAKGGVVYVERLDKTLHWDEVDKCFLDGMGRRYTQRGVPFPEAIDSAHAVSVSGVEQFKQIVDRPTHDGDLVSKELRDRLVGHGLVDRGYGFNYLTAQGVSVAVALCLLRSSR